MSPEVIRPFLVTTAHYDSQDLASLLTNYQKIVTSRFKDETIHDFTWTRAYVCCRDKCVTCPLPKSRHPTALQTVVRPKRAFVVASSSDTVGADNFISSRRRLTLLVAASFLAVRRLLWPRQIVVGKLSSLSPPALCLGMGPRQHGRWTEIFCLA